MNVNRVYSHITVKAFDDDLRELTGIATTPSTDRVGDIVEPKGAKFSLPVPFLWQHNHQQPIGNVVSAKVGKDGIEVKVKLVKPEAGMPSQLVARLEEAWASIKSGLVRGLSIGFSAREYSFIDNGGIKFTEWDWHELSAVTIPANAEASITSIKSVSEQQLSASGSAVAQKAPVGVTTKSKPIQLFKPLEANMNIQERIKRLQETVAQKQERMKQLMEEADKAGTTMDAAQAEEFDTLTDEVKSLQQDIERSKALEVAAIATAKSVSATPEAQKTAIVGAKGGEIELKKAPLKNGLGLAQMVKYLGRAKGSWYEAEAMASRDPAAHPEVVAAIKTAVAAGTTANAQWAGNLITPNGIYADFLEFLRPETILGKFGQGAVPAYNTIPFRTPVIGQTSGGAGYWVGEGNAKPLTKFDFSKSQLDPLKVANIAVVTQELLRDSSPNADVLIRNSLVAALAERLDIDFIDPAKAAVLNLSPASITNGVTPVQSSGTDAAAVRSDIAALVRAFKAAGNKVTSGVLIMDSNTALSLSLMQNPLGQAEFTGLSQSGGVLFGMPVIVSDYVPTDSAGGMVVLVNAREIYVGDDGGFQVDYSDQASLQMDDNPDNPTTATTVLVSLWQRNLAGFRAERTINWMKGKASSVQYLSGVNWGG